MSRAFVKETDDVPELPDRSVSQHPNVVTRRGFDLIETEITRLRSALVGAQADRDRQRIAAAARELRYWTARRASAQVQAAPTANDVVRFGSRVRLKRDPPTASGVCTQSFRIVGEDEADPAAGTLSYVSPLARSLIGRAVGDVVPMGQGEAEILAIEAEED